MKVILSARNTGERWEKKEDLLWKDGTEGDIKVDSSVTYQTIIGFGGAFTESTAVTLSRLSPENRMAALNSYYSEEDGLGYTMGRIHIHSNDFALGNYTYIEENDKELKTFSIEHDRELILPLIKDAMKIAGRPLHLLA